MFNENIIDISDDKMICKIKNEMIDLITNKSLSLDVLKSENEKDTFAVIILNKGEIKCSITKEIRSSEDIIKTKNELITIINLVTS